MHQENSYNHHGNNEQEKSVELLKQRVYELIEQAEQARQAFLEAAHAGGMKHDEILEAANEAFNKRRLPRVGTGDVMRGGSYQFAIVGDEVPAGEFPATIQKQHEEQVLIFKESPTGELPYKEELDDPEAPGVYYVRSIAIGFPDSKDTLEDWQDHVTALEEALRTTDQN